MKLKEYSTKKHEVKRDNTMCLKFQITKFNSYVAKYYIIMYKNLGMNDTVNDKKFNHGFEFQSPKYADTCQVIKQ